MKKILIVEDDEDISNAMAIRLRASGFKVLVAHDALTGMTLALSERPDLAVLDISMPGGNGFQLSDSMNDLPPLANIPVIFVTASKRPHLREQAEGCGAVGFFEKPYDSVELLGLIDRVLGLEANSF